MILSEVFCKYQKMISCEVLVNVRKKILNEVSSEHAKLTRSLTIKYFYLQRFPSRSPVVTDHN